MLKNYKNKVFIRVKKSVLTKTRIYFLSTCRKVLRLTSSHTSQDIFFIWNKDFVWKIQVVEVIYTKALKNSDNYLVFEESTYTKILLYNKHRYGK